MQSTKLSLMTWIFMLYFMCDSKQGLSALELSRKVGIGYTSARLNARKINNVEAGATLITDGKT